MHGADQRRALMHGADFQRRAPMNILKLGAVHGQKKILAKLRYVGSKRRCRAEGRVALSQTQQKNDDISCSIFFI